MRLIREDQAAAEEGLGTFLAWPQRRTDFSPLVLDGGQLNTLTRNPGPRLKAAFRKSFHRFLIQVYPPGSVERRPVIPSWIFVLALVVHNCLATLQPDGDVETGRSVDAYNRTLVKTLPTPQGTDAALAFQAVLENARPYWPRLLQSPDSLFSSLLELHPWSAFEALNLHTPAVFAPLGVELLGWPKPSAPEDQVRPDFVSWLDPLKPLLADPNLSCRLIHHWLTWPETNLSCRNMGLALEAMRRSGLWRDFILTFYETYDYFRARKATDNWGRPFRTWPIVETMGRLLSFSGDSEGAMAVNRRGLEYFMLFRPLFETIISEKGLPADFRWLRPDFIDNLRPLLRYVPESHGPAFSFTSPVFSSPKGP